jgi:hypothetical protein
VHNPSHSVPLAVRRTGLPVEDVAPDFHFGRIAGRVMPRHPMLTRAELAGRGGTRVVAPLFGAVNGQLADGVSALADRWQPDLVVHEPLAVAGALAAARRAVPAVLLENSLYDGPELVRVTAARLPRITAATLDRLVSDTGLATAAGEVRREMAAMPAPAELVPRLVALAG